MKAFVSRKHPPQSSAIMPRNDLSTSGAVPNHMWEDSVTGEKLQARMDRADADDAVEMDKILDFAIKAHSKSYRASPAMQEAFYNEVKGQAWSCYQRTPPPSTLCRLPSHADLYEWMDDPDDSACDEIPPNVPYQFVLQILLTNGTTRFFARPLDKRRRDVYVSWEAFGAERMAALTSRVRDTIISKWEEYNAQRAVEHARYYLHKKWAAMVPGAHKRLDYDFAPLQEIFHRFPQFLIDYEQKAPRFWGTDAEKIPTTSGLSTS